MFEQHSITTEEYTIDQARERFRELIRSQYSTPDEAEEIVLLTVYIADAIVFEETDQCSREINASQRSTQR